MGKINTIERLPRAIAKNDENFQLLFGCWCFIFLTDDLPLSTYSKNDVLSYFEKIMILIISVDVLISLTSFFLLQRLSHECSTKVIIIKINKNYRLNFLQLSSIMLANSLQMIGNQKSIKTKIIHHPHTPHHQLNLI